MNRTLIRPALAFLCGALVAATPVLAETVRGNGVIRTQARSASGFTGVELGLPARVELRLGDTDSVTVEADENLLPQIETVVRNGSLEIKAARRNLNLESKAIKVVVQARRIDALEIGGSGTIAAEPLRTSRLSLEIGGSGSIDVKRVDANRIDVSIGGSGNVKLAGTAKKLDVSIGGSGNVVAPALVADEAEIDIAGSGDTQVAARTKLDVTIAGSGSVAYAGDPAVRRTVLGVGRITRIGPLPQ